jgi:putative oxidoreductase
MAPVRRAARVLVAGVFIHGGWATLRSPEPRVQDAGPLLARFRAAMPVLPGDGTLVRSNAAVHLGAGLLLACGACPRPAAGLLALSLVPTTAAGHPFWEAGADRRGAELASFVKNAGILGALLLLAAGPG